VVFKSTVIYGTITLAIFYYKLAAVSLVKERQAIFSPSVKAKLYINY
jgi:hypothetical protein